VDQANSLRKIIDFKTSQLKKKLSASNTNNNNDNSHHRCAPRVFSITSGKGGVGKTNIVGNLALAFARLNKNVLILDADLGLANIDIIFNIYPKYNIWHVINGHKELSEIIVDGPEGIKIIPAGSGFADLTNLTEGQKLNLLNEFEILDNFVDILLIDTGAGISSNVLYFNIAADECIVVATPEPTSITDAYAMIKVMATQHSMKYFKLLVNMANSENEAKSVYLNLNRVCNRFLTNVLIDYIGFILNDKLIKNAILNRKTVMHLYPHAKSSKNIKQLAVNILGSRRRINSDGNIKFFFNRYISSMIN